MVTGASARSVEDIVKMVADGLGAERVDLRIGYTSLVITVFQNQHGITRVQKVGYMGEYVFGRGNLAPCGAGLGAGLGSL